MWLLPLPGVVAGSNILTPNHGQFKMVIKQMTKRNFCDREYSRTSPTTNKITGNIMKYAFLLSYLNSMGDWEYHPYLI